MLSYSALPCLDSSQDIVSESQIAPSPSLPCITVALPRSPPRLEPSFTPSPGPETSSGIQPPSLSEEPQTGRKLILRKRSTSPLQVKLPFMTDRLRIRSPKSLSPQCAPFPGTQLAGTVPSPRVVGRPDALRALGTGDTTSGPITGSSSDDENVLVGGEGQSTPGDMLPIRKVRFLTPPSSPEELTTDCSEPQGSESTSEDELIYSTTGSPSDLPLANFPLPDDLPWPPLLHEQSAGGLLTATTQLSSTNAKTNTLGLVLEPACGANGYRLPAMDTWEEIYEDLRCTLEVCAVLADLDRSSPGSMRAMYREPELYTTMDYAHARCGSGGLWNCRVFPSTLF